HPLLPPHPSHQLHSTFTHLHAFPTRRSSDLTLLGIFKMLFSRPIPIHKDGLNNNYLTLYMVEGKNLVIKSPYRFRECKFSRRWFRQILYFTHRIVGRKAHRSPHKSGKFRQVVLTVSRCQLFEGVKVILIKFFSNISVLFKGNSVVLKMEYLIRIAAQK